MECKQNVEKIPDCAEIETLAPEVCPVDWAKACIRIACRENCGKSVMCRDGMVQLSLILEDITSGKGRGDDLELLQELCQVISTSTGCALSAKAAANVLYSMEHYGAEWELHCSRRRCTALVCTHYYGVYIDPTLCDGCGQCMTHAAPGAVQGRIGLIHVVADEDAVKDPEFLRCCPRGAIKKYGAVKPRGVPEQPVPVGTVSALGGTRRRRRLAGSAKED